MADRIVDDPGEERRFRRELRDSYRSVLAYGLHLELGGWLVEIQPCADLRRLRGGFAARRRRYIDQGDLYVWGVGRYEVKGRGLDFTCSDDFPYSTVNIDRANKSLGLARAYVSVNRWRTHAAVVDTETTRDRWREEVSKDERRGYAPFLVWRCPVRYVRFVELRRRRSY